MTSQWYDLHSATIEPLSQPHRWRSPSRPPRRWSLSGSLITLTVALAVLVGCSDDEPDDPRLDTPAACLVEPTITAENPALIWTPNATVLVSEEMSPGVFAVYASDAAEKGPEGVPLPTSSGFVIGDDGVLVVDTMINQQLACQLISLIREETDKPIRYVVNTSYHGDHSYGNYVFPETTQIVHHERTRAYIAEHFETDLVFMEQNFGKDQGIDQVVPRTADITVSDEGMTLDLGGRTVELHYFGFAQTPGDLFVWLPDAQVMWTGNPLIAERPAIPWLLDGHLVDAIASLGAVRDFLPADAEIVPGHGRPVTRSSLSYSVEYLETLRDQVQVAIDDGLSEVETVGRVTMDEFAEYAIYGWVHPQVNVPAAYAELTAD